MTNAQNPRDLPDSIPEGIVGYRKNDKGEWQFDIDPIAIDQKWKDRLVNSASFKKLPPDKKFYKLAKSFLSESVLYLSKVSTSE